MGQHRARCCHVYDLTVIAGQPPESAPRTSPVAGRSCRWRNSNDNSATEFREWEARMDESCPACGESVDQCTGHTRNADPYGWLVVSQHAVGEHTNCDPAGCRTAAARVRAPRSVWARIGW